VTVTAIILLLVVVMMMLGRCWKRGWRWYRRSRCYSRLTDAVRQAPSPA
jgi:O-antigen ligase